MTRRTRIRLPSRVESMAEVADSERQREVWWVGDTNKRGSERQDMSPRSATARLASSTWMRTKIADNGDYEKGSYTGDAPKASQGRSMSMQSLHELVKAQREKMLKDLD